MIYLEINEIRKYNKKEIFIDFSIIILFFETHNSMR